LHFVWKRPFSWITILLGITIIFCQSCTRCDQLTNHSFMFP
jgi:hypothetical protein